MRGTRRRLAPVLAVVVLLTGATAGCDDKATPTPARSTGPSCPPVVPAPARKVPFSTVYLNILNGGGASGLAGKTKVQLEWRGFHILDAGNLSLLDDHPAPVYSQIRYGKGARTIALNLATQVKYPELVEIDRTDPVVDLVLGSRFALTPVPPPPAGQVRLNVYNTTFRSGLSGQASAALKERGFVIGSNGNDPKKSFLPNDSAVIRHGEQGEPYARRAQLQIAGARLEQDSRTDTTVDIALGNKYEQLVPLADTLKPPSSGPTRPPGC